MGQIIVLVVVTWLALQLLWSEVPMPKVLGCGTLPSMI